ncbi:hypothetical protein TWF788_006253 [Orbilia oligospora]|uniref:Uncharacterized protein n=1 Tax=Orbilia oligospora TaxID=2813651 RepID=A0A7C8PXA1_ORBOL|nr:hypothetical protein TWF788_006253 [Orbilia oligospora]
MMVTLRPPHLMPPQEARVGHGQALRDPSVPEPPAEGDNIPHKSNNSLRHPDLPIAGGELPRQYQDHNHREQYTYKLICLDKDLIIYDDDSTTATTKFKRNSFRRSQYQIKVNNDNNDDDGGGNEKPQIGSTNASGNDPRKPENNPIQSATYKDFDNPTALINDPISELSKIATRPRNYRPTYRYFLREAQDLDYGDMLAIFSVCRSYDDDYIRPIMELMPDALFAIQTIKASLNADEMKNGTNKEWEMAQLFYFMVEGGHACLFLERREASRLRISAEIEEFIQHEPEDGREGKVERQVTPKRSLIRKLLRLPPKKPKRPLTEEEIRRTEEIIMAIRII